MEKLFIYGTLKDITLREKLSGRRIPALRKDILTGYSLTQVSDDGITYPAIYKNPESKTPILGEVIEVTKPELNIFDKYEGDLYTRQNIQLNSSEIIWSYLKK